MTAPKLSVTITNYNYAQFLPRAIESILAQTFTDFEVIIVDNASTDNSREVIERYAAEDERVIPVCHSQDQGALASLRETCDLARGTYRVHIDADDWVISPEAFALQVAQLDAEPTMGFTYSCMVQMADEDQVIWVSHPYSSDQILSGAEALEAVLSFNLNHSGMMLRLGTYESSGGYTAGFPQCDDMQLAAKMCEFGAVGYLDRQLYAFRQHGANRNLLPDLAVVREQYLPVMETALHGPLADQIDDIGAVRRRVIRKALLHLPTQFVFAGRISDGWRLLWESAKVRPLETVLQPQFVALVARTMLGSRLYDAASSRMPQP